MTTDLEKLLRIVYTPADVARLTMNAIEGRMSGNIKSVSTGIPSLDNVLLPFFPGELIVVLARTSHFKTGFLQYMARHIASQIWQEQQDEKDTPKEISVYVSWETSIEEIGIFDLAQTTKLSASEVWRGNATDKDMERLRTASMKRAVSPLWVMGHSMARRMELQRLTLVTIRDALLSIEQEMGFKPRAIMLDYLQEIDSVEGETWREKMINNVDRAKQLARDCGCPVFLGVQAGRHVDDRAFKLPEIGDGQETSRIEQAADKVLSLWIPSNNLPIGETIPVLDIPVSENMLILGVRKQRLGEAGNIIPLYIDPAKNTIAAMQLEYGELDDFSRKGNGRNGHGRNDY